MRIARTFAVVFVLLILFGSLSAQTEANSQTNSTDPSLSFIANIREFSDALKNNSRKDFVLTDAQKAKLIQNNFVVTPSNAEQFFHIYESQHYGLAPRIPNFITSDCVLQVYHMFFDFTLRAIEVEELYPALLELTQQMLQESKRQYNLIKDPALKSVCLKNMAFFGVAAKLSGHEDTDLVPEARAMVDVEYENIMQQSGRKSSGLIPNGQDYTQYIVRGHYTRSEDLKSFFRAMMWYGQTGFSFSFQGKRTEEQVLQMLLMTHILFETKTDSESVYPYWDKVYSITTQYVGAADDITPQQFYDLAKDIYKPTGSLDIFADKDKLDLLYKKIEKLPNPRIKQQAEGIFTGLQFRFMGQRFIPDSYIMQTLTFWPARPFPKGMDVMAVLGSKRASEILDNLYKEPATWDQYLPKRAKLKDEFSTWTEKDWSTSLYSGWIYTLQTLLEEREKSAPKFMQSEAWTDKQLNTALASWAEGRHDVILYAKPSMAEGGDGEPPQPRPKGYVEPIPKFFARLLKLVQNTSDVIERNHAMKDDLKDLFTQYEKMLSDLKTIAEKEARNEPVTDEEYGIIQWIGSKIEAISLAIVELDRNLPFIDPYSGDKVEHQSQRLRGWFEVTGTDQDVACIADVHTSQENCLEEAVGHINTIYVIVPIEGKQYLTRGGVFSYYEFVYPASHRFTDEAWQEMIKRDRAPELPPWTSSFFVK